MPLNVNSVPVLVRSALRARGADFSNLRNPAILAQINPALRELAQLNHPRLRKTFSVTATDGEAALTSALSAIEPLVLTGLRSAQIYIQGFTKPAQWKPDLSSLSDDLTTEFAYWTLEDQTILIRDATGTDNYDGPMTIRNAPFVPLLASVPPELEPVFIDLLITRLYASKPANMVAANPG